MCVNTCTHRGMVLIRKPRSWASTPPSSRKHCQSFRVTLRFTGMTLLERRGHDPKLLAYLETSIYFFSIHSFSFPIINLVATMCVMLRHTQACAFFKMHVCMCSRLCVRVCAGMCVLWKTTLALTLQALFKVESLSLVWNSTSRLSWLTPQGSTRVIQAFLMWTLGCNLGSRVCTASASLELHYQPRLCLGICTPRQPGCASGSAHQGSLAQASFTFAPLVSWLNVWRSGCS